MPDAAGSAGLGIVLHEEEVVFRAVGAHHRRQMRHDDVRPRQSRLQSIDGVCELRERPTQQPRRVGEVDTREGIRSPLPGVRSGRHRSGERGEGREVEHSPGRAQQARVRRRTAPGGRPARARRSRRWTPVPRAGGAHEGGLLRHPHRGYRPHPAPRRRAPAVSAPKPEQPRVVAAELVLQLRDDRYSRAQFLLRDEGADSDRCGEDDKNGGHDTECDPRDSRRAHP